MTYIAHKGEHYSVWSGSRWVGRVAKVGRIIAGITGEKWGERARWEKHECGMERERNIPVSLKYIIPPIRVALHSEGTTKHLSYSFSPLTLVSPLLSFALFFISFWLSLSLSISIYIYIYMYVCIYALAYLLYQHTFPLSTLFHLPGITRKSFLPVYCETALLGGRWKLWVTSSTDETRG